MENIIDKVHEIDEQILTLKHWVQYTKDQETKESLLNDIEILEAKKDIWLAFLS